MNIVFGFISWFPGDKRRNERINRLNKCFEQIKNIFGDVNYLIIAQNWQDYTVPEFVKNVDIFKYSKLGILGARKKLREHFLESNYDFLIMCDDDIVLKTNKDFSKEYFFSEIMKHPNGYFFLKHGWALSFCGISKAMYQKEPMIDLDPEKGEAYEDVTFAELLKYKYPKEEFKIKNIDFLQNKAEYYHKEHKSTWDCKQVNHEDLTLRTKFYTMRFANGVFDIDKKLCDKYLVEAKYYEEANFWQWCTPEQYLNFLRKYKCKP